MHTDVLMLTMKLSFNINIYIQQTPYLYEL